MRTILSALATLLLTIPPHAIAEPADDAQMAAEALSPVIGGRLPSAKRHERIADSHARVRAKSVSSPDSLVAAEIVFSTGQRISDLALLSGRYRLEFIDLHLKAPYDDDGMVQSVDLGVWELASKNGNVVARANRAMNEIRYDFLRMSQSFSGETGKAYAKLVTRDFLVYRASAYCTARELELMSADPDIALIALWSDDKSERAINDHQMMRARAIQAWTDFEETK